MRCENDPVIANLARITCFVTQNGVGASVPKACNQLCGAVVHEEIAERGMKHNDLQWSLQRTGDWLRWLIVVRLAGDLSYELGGLELGKDFAAFKASVFYQMFMRIHPGGSNVRVG